jgi:hypothetical protein
MLGCNTLPPPAKAVSGWTCVGNWAVAVMVTGTVPSGIQSFTAVMLNVAELWPVGITT